MQRREFLAGGSAALGAAAAGPAGEAGAVSGAATTSAGPGSVAQGNLALYNGRFITLGRARPTAEAVLIRDGRIVHVGTNREVRAAAGRSPDFDLRGRTVVPGFVDNHCHIEDSCLVGDEHPNLNGQRSIPAMIEYMRAHAQRLPDGATAVFTAFGFPDIVTEKRWLTREDLDAVSDSRPVMVLLGVHASILNTAAWKMTGYWEPGNESKVLWSDGSPRLGSHIYRDSAGHPTGIGTEIWDFRPHYTAEAYKRSIRRHFKDWFLAKGLTSMTTIPNDSPGQFQALQELQREGAMPARLRVYPIIPHSLPLSSVEILGLQTGLGDGMLRFGGVKLFVDNGWDGMSGSRSDLKWTREGLTDALTRCQRAGLQVIMHVVTAEGMALTLDCIEAARQAAPRALRHRIDHLTPTDLAQIRRVRSLDVTLGITAPRVAPGTPPAGIGAYSRRHRYRTLLAEGVSTILVLDAAGPGGNYEVFQGIANVVNDVDAGGTTPRGETVSLETALRMWTLWPAESNGEGHEKGSIEVGKFGDLAVLAADPRGLAISDLYALRVDATIVGGSVVFGG